MTDLAQGWPERPDEDRDRWEPVGAAIADAFWLGTWPHVAEMLETRLTPEEREILAGVMMLVAEPDHVLRFIDGWLREFTGAPPAAIRGELAEQARLWAQHATEAERKQYLLAALRSLPKIDRVRFLAAVQKEALAA